MGSRRVLTRCGLSLILLALTACSGLIRDQQLREAYLDRFVAQPEHFILVSNLPLHGEPQLELFGLGDPGERFSREFALDSHVTGLAENMLGLMPQLAPSRIVRPGELHKLPAGLQHSAPVLLLHSNWRLLYRRMPPDLERNRVQLSVLAKVIPLGQVLSGKGLLDVPSTAWQAYCIHDALGGAFFSLDEWGANDGERLREALRQSQQHCARELAQELAAGVSGRP